jgi:hypothetical protein
MSQLKQAQRLDLGQFAEACKRVKVDQTLTVRVVLDRAGKEPREYLVQVVRFHLTHELALIGISTDLKLNERFVPPVWLKERLGAVRRIEAILAILNRKKNRAR